MATHIDCGHIGVIRIYSDICETAKAGRFVGVKAAQLRKYAKEMGPGARVTNPQKGRAVTFLGNHPDPDYWGDEWWRQTEAPCQ